MRRSKNYDILNYMRFLFFIFIFSISLSATEYKLGSSYYFCKHDSGFNGYFSIQKRDGTIENPYIYNPDLPSRWYIYFLYSEYPIPFHYATIAEETPDKIFLQGTHMPSYSDSSKYEVYSAVLNKQTMLMEWTNLNHKNEITKFKSQCSITRE